MGDYIVALAGIALGGVVVTQVFTVIKLSMQRKQGVAPRELAAIDARLERIEQAIDTMAVEVERVSEGQRFATNLLAERARGDRAPLDRVAAPRPTEPQA